MGDQYINPSREYEHTRIGNVVATPPRLLFVNDLQPREVIDIYTDRYMNTNDLISVRNFDPESVLIVAQK